MGLFTKLWEIICQIPPFIVVNHYELAVRLRFGKFTTPLGPGIHWRIPLVHEVITCDCKEAAIDLSSQVIGDMAVESTLRYEVEDAELALLEVTDYEDSLINFTIGLIGERMLIGNYTSKELAVEVLEDLQLEAETWGINVMRLKFSTFAKARVLRLLGASLL